ncbi:MAG: AbrB/MazE/SpoVT family DNA-binding domain-containing protein [Candidatus Helarchaeota archaeon]
MKIKTKLHSSQVYIPKKILELLSIGPNSEVYMELDEENQVLIITLHENEKVSKAQVLDMIENPPLPSKGKYQEDQVEYNYEDI